MTAEQVGLLAKKITPIARAEWPLPIKALALLSRATDHGIGDVIARIHRAGGRRYLQDVVSGEIWQAVWVFRAPVGFER